MIVHNNGTAFFVLNTAIREEKSPFRLMFDFESDPDDGIFFVDYMTVEKDYTTVEKTVGDEWKKPFPGYFAKTSKAFWLLKQRFEALGEKAEYPNGMLEFWEYTLFEISDVDVNKANAAIEYVIDSGLYELGFRLLISNKHGFAAYCLTGVSLEKVMTQYKGVIAAINLMLGENQVERMPLKTEKISATEIKVTGTPYATVSYLFFYEGGYTGSHSFANMPTQLDYKGELILSDSLGRNAVRVDISYEK